MLYKEVIQLLMSLSDQMYMKYANLKSLVMYLVA